jgi:hypothetical protein
MSLSLYTTRMMMMMVPLMIKLLVMKPIDRM